MLDKLERRFGRYAIPQLILYVVGINGLMYLLSYAYPQSDLFGMLALVPHRIMQGEVWRLITFVFIPPAASLLWIFFILYFTWMIGSALEQEWGSFRFNLYYFAGILATAAGAFAAGGGATALYLNLSLFLAFARIYPDYEVLLFFVLPVKVKYLAWLNWFFLAFTVLTAPLSVKVAALVSVANYFLFFGRDTFLKAKARGSAHQRKKPFRALQEDRTIHRCTICGKTEKDDPAMDFRYCSSCEGDFEYCMDHLKTHKHKRKAQDGQGKEE